MKISRRAHIHKVMPHLVPTQPFIQTFCLLLAIGCSSRIEVAQDNTGGTGAVGGGTSAAGGFTGTCDTGHPGCVAVSPSGNTGGMTATGSFDATGGYDATGSFDAIGGYDATGGALSTSPRVCTPGADQTCNDNWSISALWGHCEADAWCSCNDGYVVNPSTGKCNTYNQTVCYSPMQNMDKAYVDRAFGCDCNSSTSTPYCGIDANGLLVYLACKNGQWQSGNTGMCLDPKTCFSPTQNAEHALEAGAVGCTCDAAPNQTVCIAIEADGGVVAVDAGIFASDAGDIPQTAVLACSSGKWIAWNGAAFGCQ